MTIKKKLYGIVFGEMIMFLIVVAVVISAILPIMKLNNESDALSQLAEKVLVTRINMLSLISSPLALQYEELEQAKTELSDSFRVVEGLDALKSINRNVSESIDSILKLETIFNERWDVLTGLFPVILDDAMRVMFSTSVPLIRFYKSDYSHRLADYDQIMYQVEEFERAVDITEGALSSAYDVVNTQFEIIEKELNNKIFQMILRSAIIFMVMMIAIIIVVSRIASGMAVSLTSFATGVSLLRDGRLDADFNITTRDEIGQLGENLTEFSSALSASILKIKESSRSTLRMKAELSGAAEEARISAQGITEAVVSIREGMIDLDGRVAESGTSVTTVNTRTGDLKNMLEEQTAMVEESTSSVTEMIASINNVSEITAKKKAATEVLVKTAGNGGEKLDETIGIIQQITANVDEIKGTASIIQSVAAQTSLLAMNAAIEAAHAGEYGAGFSVVAEEIRKLAEASGASSKRISGVLKEVIVSIEKAANSGDETKRAFADINREVTDVAGALEEISSSMDELAVGGKQILEAMNGLQGYTAGVQDGGTAMSEAAGSLEGAFKTVERVTNEVLSQIGGIGTRIEEITRVVGVVSSISSGLSIESEQLADEVARFSTSEDSEGQAVQSGETPADDELLSVPAENETAD